MKKIFFVPVSLAAIFFGLSARADVLIPDEIRVPVCTKIVNTADFPDTVFVGAVYDANETNHNGDIKIYTVNPGECLNTGGRAGRYFYGLTVFALEKNYYDGLVSGNSLNDKILRFTEGIETSDLVARADWQGEWTPVGTSKDKNLKSNSSEIKVLGFSGNKLLLYKSKDVSEFNSGQPKVQTYDKPQAKGFKTSWSAAGPAGDDDITKSDDTAGDDTVATGDDTAKNEPVVDDDYTKPMPPVQRSFWQNIWCGFIGIFGFNCQ